MTRREYIHKINAFKPVVSDVQIVKVITPLAIFSKIIFKSVKRDVSTTEELSYNTGN